MKTSELSGWSLTYWVARSLGYVFNYYVTSPHGACYRVTHPDPDIADIGNVILFEHGVMAGDKVEPAWSAEMPDFAGDIRAAWPIIKADRICIDQESDFSEACGYPGAAYACMPGFHTGQFDPDPLIAAMRCKVASVFGDVVEKMRIFG